MDSSLSRRTQNSLSLATSSPPELHQDIPSPAERHNPSSESSRGPSPSRTCPEHLPREAPRRHPDYSNTSTLFSRLTKLLILCLRPPCLYLWSCSFSHYLEPVAINEGRKLDRLVNWQPCLSAPLSLHHNIMGQSPNYWFLCWPPAPFFSRPWTGPQVYLNSTKIYK